LYDLLKSTPHFEGCISYKGTFTHQRFVLSSGIFRHEFPTETMYALLIPPTNAIIQDHLILHLNYHDNIT